MWNLVFLFAGFFFISLLLIVFNSKTRLSSIENKIFLLLSIVNLIGYISEITLQFAIRSPLDDGSFITLILGKFYVAYILIWMGIFSIYTFLITKKSESEEIHYDKPKEYKIMRLIHIIIILTTAIVVFILPLSIFHEGDSMYSYGAGVEFLRIILAGYIIIWLIRLAMNFKTIKEKKYYAIFTVIILLLANVILQAFNPTVLIATFTMTFTCFVLFFTIENPDLQMLKEMQLARDQAEKANRAKSDFLSSMSHEIRTPLNVISGFTETLKSSNNLTDEEKDNLKDIKNASDTLLDIINNILDMSKIESGNMNIDNVNYNTKELFSSVSSLIEYKIKEKGLKFTVKIAPDIPKELYGARKGIKTIITNLLSNAAKYTDQGSVDYDVKSVVKKDLCRLIITVSDTGKGIKKENIEKLFTKFERLDERNTTIEGTGLGLAITKSLLNEMGGNITVNSELGVGSRFVVTLDQKIVDANPIGEFIDYTSNVDTEINKESIQLDNTKVEMSAKRVLIVDDNNLNLKVESNLLKKNFNMSDNNIVTVLSGQECIDRIKADEKYDLILMDDMMPNMDGQETFKKLKLLSGFNIPTIMLTANAVEGAREHYLKQGFIYYLSKPVKIDEMNKAFEYIFKENTNKSNEIKIKDDIKDNKVDLEKTVQFPPLPKELYQIGEIDDNNKS